MNVNLVPKGHLHVVFLELFQSADGAYCHRFASPRRKRCVALCGVQRIVWDTIWNKYPLYSDSRIPDDGSGSDYLMAACYNAAGEVLDTDEYGPSTSATPLNSNFSCSVYSMDGSPPSDLVPVTFKLFDISSNISENQLANMPAIEASPLLACYGPGCSGASSSSFGIFDGRLNSADEGASAAVYCYAGGYRVYHIDDEGHGHLVLELSADEVAAGMTQAADSGANVLLASADSVDFWVLAPGDKFQIVAPDVHEPGKDYDYVYGLVC